MSDKNNYFLAGIKHQLNNKPISALLVDSNMHILFMNVEYQKQFLYSHKNELNDTNFKSIIHPKDHFKLKEIMDIVKDHKNHIQSNIKDLGKYSISELNTASENIKIELKM